MLEHRGPRGRVEASCCFTPARESPRHGLLASARSGPSDLRNPGPIRASDTRRPPCRANREHHDGFGAFPRAPCTVTSPSADEGSWLSPRPRFCSPFSLETEGRITARCHLRRDGLPPCRICLRDHPRAPPCFTLDPRWIRNALGQVRCEPILLRAAEGVLRPIRRPAPIRCFVASFRCARVCEQRPGWCAEHLVVAPAWPAVRRYRRPARQLFRRGRASACALSRRFRVRDGDCSPFGRVASSHEDPPDCAAPRRIDTT